jgi:beta-D-xylosidase 4
VWQEVDAHGYPKMLALLKHFTAYSTETNRGHDSYTISMHDLWDTYLAQYEIAFVRGGAAGVMCR